MLTGYPLSRLLGRSVLDIGSGVARFLMTAEYVTYRYLRCVVNVMLLLSQLSVSKEFFFMQGLGMMLIRNTVFVDFTDYSAAFLQSKLSVVDECLLTESTIVNL